MKKIGLFGVIAIVVIIVIAAMMAGKMGETSHAYARGRVILDESVLTEAKENHTLFIIMAGNDRPMPLGALRKSIDVTSAGEIYSFTLTKDSMQMMMMAAGGGPGGGGSNVPEQFKLKARLDRDGQAGPDQPGDVVGEVAVVKRGAEDVEIHLNRVIH